MSGSGPGHESEPGHAPPARAVPPVIEGAGVIQSKPVWDRGRAGRLAGALMDYVRTAWWGVVSPRTKEKESLVITQAVVLRSREGAMARIESDEVDVASQEVLLSIRSDLFGWELPGGTPEPGESLETTVIREVFEETGLEVVVEATIGDWIRSGFRPHRVRVYLCRAVGGVLTPSHETPRVNWFPISAPPAELFPWYAEPLAEGLRVASSEDSARAPVERHERQGLASILGAMKIDLGMRWRGLP